MGFITKTNSIAPDGQKGNAHPPNLPEDRWRFSMHQIGQVGVWVWSKFYDPTFGKIYDGNDDFIDWHVIKNVGGYVLTTETHEIALVNSMANYGWSEWVYYELTKPLSSNTSLQSVANSDHSAIFTGNYIAYAIDSNANN